MSELDTRALTRHLRERGTLRGVMRVYPADAQPDLDALATEARSVRSVSELDVVAEVAQDDVTPWAGAVAPGAPRVLLIDTGYKHNIARCLAARGLEVLVAPPRVDLAEVKRLRPDGVLLANGPGDPESVQALVELTQELVWRERMPLMGICLGHQVLGLAAGARTSRLPFGHHGANHPVREVRTGKVTLTSQNHNFQVEAASLPASSGLYVSHVNLSDGSVEGLAHETLPVFSVQYHPEAAPGPEDNRYLFDRFAEMIRQERSARETEVGREHAEMAMAG
jgi:carbamoyl-phosphate synthase small subunit